MNTHEILGGFKLIAKCRPSTQYHVVPCDKLISLKVQSYPFMVCLNTDDSTKPGSHWLGLYIARQGAEVELFDSYGLPFFKYSDYVREFVEKNGLRLIQKREMLQSPISQVCGQYVLCYMLHRLRGCSRASFYAKFSNDLISNDKIVYNIVRRLFISRINCKYFQVCKSFINQ